MSSILGGYPTCFAFARNKEQEIFLLFLINLINLTLPKPMKNPFCFSLTNVISF